MSVALPDIRPCAFVLGLSPTGLYAVRELGQADVRVVGVGQRSQPGRASRYLDQFIADCSDSEKLAKLLATAAQLPGGPHVLVPTSDQDVQFVQDNANALRDAFVFQTSFVDGAASQVMEKALFYQACESMGVAYPKMWATDPSGLPGLADVVAFPCIVKPSRIHDIKHEMRGKKGWIVHGRSELIGLVAELPESVGTLVVQEVVPGAESEISLCCCYMNQAGQPQQIFTARKLRQYPSGFGSASLVQGCPEPEAREIATTLLSNMGYHGVAAAEFKRDPNTRALKIIEVNVRPSLWFEAAGAAGCTPVLAMYAELAFGICIADAPQKDGIRWRYGLKDAASSVFYRRNRAYFLPRPDLNVVGAPTARVSAVFRRDDPAPAFAELGRYALKLRDRIGSTS